MKPVTEETPGQIKVLMLGCLVDLLQAAQTLEFLRGAHSPMAVFWAEPSALIYQAASLVESMGLSAMEVFDLCEAAGSGGLAGQLVLGDAIIRPHLVLETDELKGQGLDGLATMHPEDWARVSRVLLNPSGRTL